MYETFTAALLACGKEQPRFATYMRFVRGVKGSEIAGCEQLKTHSRIHRMHNQNLNFSRPLKNVAQKACPCILETHQKEFCGMQRGGQPVNIVVRGAQQQLHNDMH